MTGKMTPGHRPGKERHAEHAQVCAMRIYTSGAACRLAGSMLLRRRERGKPRVLCVAPPNCVLPARERTSMMAKVHLVEQLHDPLGMPLDVHAQGDAAALEPGLGERRGHAAVATGRAAPRAKGLAQMRDLLSTS